MILRDPLDALRPSVPCPDLRARVLAAASEARCEATASLHWLDAAAGSIFLRYLWRFAMLAAVVAHLWVGDEATRAARHWRLVPAPDPIVERLGGFSIDPQSDLTRVP